MIMRDNFCLFCRKAYVVTAHLNRLDETVQMRYHNGSDEKSQHMVSMKYKKNYP